MDMELITGTYTHTKGEEGFDFWIKLGKVLYEYCFVIVSLKLNNLRSG